MSERSSPSCQAGFVFTEEVWPASLYLKQAAVCLQKAYAGVPQPKSQLPVPVSLTGSGLPRIIPSYHRKLILKKDERADTFVKIY